jgi:hypothetical protein
MNLIEKMFSSRVLAQTESENYKNSQSQTEGRGYQVYFVSQLVEEQAKNKLGHSIKATTDSPFFQLTPDQRVRIVQACSPVLGIITSRMNRISAREFNIVSDKEQEDLIVDRLRDVYNLVNEYKSATEPQYLIASLKLKQHLKEKLYDLLPDLSNFDASLLRWSKMNKYQTKKEADKIKEWILAPNQNDSWEDFVKQWVFDIMTHGADAIYKQTLNNKVENIYHLAGGTVYPVKDIYVSSGTGYLQIIDMMEPQIFYSDELVYSKYIPISSHAYGLIPLDALINKIAESLLFDKLMAEQADGTRLPEKMIIVTDNNPFGKMDDTFKLPINKEEQKRIDKKIQTPIKGGVMTFSGNAATVVDLTRENTMGIQMQRQKDIREEIALVFNMSSMEVNLTGSDDVSGRSTAESQSEIEQGKGTLPIMAMIENKISREIFPYRYGYGYNFVYKSEISEKDELEKLRLKLSTGLYSVNEIRVKDLNENPFQGDQFNLPPSAQQQPTGSEVSPFNMRSLE